MAKWCRNLILGFVIGLLSFSLIGCGSTSKSTGGGGGSSYSGNSNISGSVIVSASDAAKVQSSMGTSSVDSFSTSVIKEKVLSGFSIKTIRALSSPTILITATAKLYELTDTGEKIYTGISVPVSNSNYLFENVKDGKNYIVEIEKIGKDSNGQTNILKLSAPAFVPAGQVTANVEVSPQTKYAVTMIVEEVVKVAKSADLSSTVINSIVTAIESAVDTMVSQGLLVIPSQVEVYVEGSSDDEISDEDSKFLEQLKSDDTVQSIKNEASAGAKMAKDPSTMTDEELKGFFSDLLGGEGAPEVFMNAFAEKYREGKMTSINLMVNSLYDSLVPSAQIPAVSSDVVKPVFLTKSIGILNGYLDSLNSFYDSGTTNARIYFPDLDDEDLNIIPYLKVVFPNGPSRLSNVTGATLLNVPQGLMFFNAMMPMDEPEEGEQQPTDNALAQLYLEYSYNPPQGDDDHDMPFDPLKFVSNMGWIEIEADKIYFMQQEVRSAMMWLPVGMYVSVNNTIDTGYDKSQYNNNPHVPVDMLDVEIELQLPEGFTSSVGSVWLRYQNSAGATVEKELVESSLLEGGSGGSGSYLEYGVEPWRIVEHWRQTSSGTTYLDRLILDYKAGQATILVKDNSNAVIAEQVFEIIKPNLGPISITYPVGPDMDKVRNGEWDHNYRPMKIGVNANGKVNPIFKWTTPAGVSSIPSKYSLAYIVELRRCVNKLDFEQSWNPPAGYYYNQDGNKREITVNDDWGSQKIWSSWDYNRMIYSNTFQAPEELPPTGESITDNYEIRYEFEVRPVLLDATTGRRIWEGGQVNTHFYVGDLDWNVNLHGSVAFPPMDTQFQNEFPSLGGQWKVGLFKMKAYEAGYTDWKDYFFDVSSQTDRVPVVGGSIGSVSYGEVIDYSFATITKNSGVFEDKTEYWIVVWLDNNDDGDIDVGAPDASINGVNFEERFFGFDMNIKYINGSLEFWKWDSTGDNWGDLTRGENQQFNLDIARHFGSGDADFGTTELFDYGPPNGDFYKDQFMGRVVLKGAYDSTNGTMSELPVTLSQMTKVALVRKYDQHMVAIVDAADAIYPSGETGRYFVSMNVLQSATSSGYITNDDYSLWIYTYPFGAGATEENLKAYTPAIFTPAVMVDDWFVRVDPPQVYMPDLAFGRVPSADALWFTVEDSLNLSHVIVQCASSPNHQVIFDLSNYDSVTMNVNYYTYHMYDYNNPVWVQGQYGVGENAGMLQLLADLGSGSIVLGFTVTPDANVDPSIVGSFVGN